MEMTETGCNAVSDKNGLHLSVVVPTYERYECLRDTLTFLQSQKGCSFEILVVDQTPPSRRQKLGGSSVRYFIQDMPSASAARNLGLLEARGEIVLFIDDDVIIEDNWFLTKHLRHYRSPAILGVAGAAPDFGQAVQYQRHRFFRNDGLGWAYYPSNQGCQAWLKVGRSNNLSVRRQAAMMIGGMDEQFERGAHREEADFCLRLGRLPGSILYDPFASLVHIGNSTGGIRAWQQDDSIKALHHMVGDLYLMFRHVPYRLRPEYLALSLRYFVFPRTRTLASRNTVAALRRYRQAWRIANAKAIEGPKLLATL